MIKILCKLSAGNCERAQEHTIRAPSPWWFTRTDGRVVTKGEARINTHGHTHTHKFQAHTAHQEYYYARANTHICAQS